MGTRIDRARLRNDFYYLANVVCQKLRKADTYHRGLITAAAFSRALDEIGLRNGQREVESLMEYITITDDGYVHYKDLVKLLTPEKPRAEKSTVKSTIFPEDEGPSRQASTRGGDDASVSSKGMLAPEAMEDLRVAYARWDRGQLTNQAFRLELQALGLQVTKELERRLIQNDMSRNLSFVELVAALRIEENDGRRARANAGDVDISLDGPAPSVGGHYERSSSSSITAANGDLQAAMRQAICDFVDGQIPAVTFRRHLLHAGVIMTPELDKMIRTHECDNCISFRDFAVVVLRQDRQEAINSGAATPVYARTPSAPSSLADGWGRRHLRHDPAASDAGSIAGSDVVGGSGGYPQRRARTPQDYSRAAGSAPGGRSDTALEARRLRHQQRSAGAGRDFLSWDTDNQGPRGGARTPPPSTRYRGIRGASEASHQALRASDNMADCLAWPTSRSFAPDDGSSRHGKRYAPREAATSIVPREKTPVWSKMGGYGEGVSDSGFDAQSALRDQVPFGTEADLDWREPEDAGTDEYKMPPMPAEIRQPFVKRR